MPRRKRQVEEGENEEVNHEAPTSASLYQVLGVERDASYEEIRKAYHKLALRLHPDKNPGDQSAKEKFQALQNVIAILGDPTKRKVYDQTGSIEDAELSTETVQNLYGFFRTMFKKVTAKEIEEFTATYRGSASEKQDLKDLYQKWNGNMDRVFSCLCCSVPEQDSHRFMDIIDDAIKAGELRSHEMYKRWASKVAERPRPLNPLELSKKRKSDGGSEHSLVAVIAGREKQRMDSLTAMLEAKYSNAGRPKKGNKFAEPSEEDFEAARQRMNDRMKRKQK